MSQLRPASGPHFCGHCGQATNLYIAGELVNGPDDLARANITAFKTLALTLMYLQLMVNVVGLSVLFVLLRL